MLLRFYLNTLKIGVPIATLGGSYLSGKYKPSAKVSTLCWDGASCGTQVILWPISLPYYGYCYFSSISSINNKD